MNLSQLTLVVGGAVVIGGLLLAMVVLIHKAFKDRRSTTRSCPSGAPKR